MNHCVIILIRNLSRGLIFSKLVSWLTVVFLQYFLAESVFHSFLSCSSVDSSSQQNFIITLDDLMWDSLTRQTYLPNLGEQWKLGLSFLQDYTRSSCWLIMWVNDSVTVNTQSRLCADYSAVSQPRNSEAEEGPGVSGCRGIKRPGGQQTGWQEYFNTPPPLMPPVVSVVSHQEQDCGVCPGPGWFWLMGPDRSTAASFCLDTVSTTVTQVKVIRLLHWECRESKSTHHFTVGAGWADYFHD